MRRPDQPVAFVAISLRNWELLPGELHDSIAFLLVETQINTHYQEGNVCTIISRDAAKRTNALSLEMFSP